MLKRIMGGLLLGFFSLHFVSTAQAVLLYDVNFSAPFHTLGATPTIDNGAIIRQGPSQIQNFNPANSSATVVNGFAALNDRPMELNAVNNNGMLGGLNLNFSLNDGSISPATALYQTDFDIIVEIVGQNQIALLWDAPSVHRVTFTPNGEIRQVGRLGVDNLLGMWSPGQLIHVTTTFNTFNGEWTAQLNGGALFSGISDQTDLNQVRIGSTTDQRGLAYIDNVLIQRFAVPEPTTLALMGLGLAGIGYRRHRSKKAA